MINYQYGGSMLKKMVKQELKPINFKCADSDREKIVEKAKEFTKGNVSEWIRHAAMNYSPPKRDLVPNE
jgi:hypothetical protein